MKNLLAGPSKKIVSVQEETVMKETTTEKMTGVGTGINIKTTKIPILPVTTQNSRGSTPTTLAGMKN